MTNSTVNFSVLAIVAVVALVTASGADAWGIDHSGHPGTNTKCERLTVSLCRGLRYNLTAMPNFMGHTDQLQAERGVIIIIIFFFQSYIQSLYVSCTCHTFGLQAVQFDLAIIVPINYFSVNFRI